MLRISHRSTPAAAALAVTGVVLVALVATGCSTARTPSVGSKPSASPSTSLAAFGISLELRTTQPFDAPSTFSVKGGRLVSAQVSRHGRPGTLRGTVTANGLTWTSVGLPLEGTSYDVLATVADATGAMHTVKAVFRVSARTGGRTLDYYVTPGAGWTVGVNAPIVIRFTHSVTDRSAVERALTVLSSAPVVGAWHWISATEVHFRPKASWPTHIRVRLIASLHNVRAGVQLWGGSNQVVDFQTGDAHLTTVDGARHTFNVYVNGKLWASWPTSLGRPQFATRSGSYIVLDKTPEIEMTSCSVHIACAKSDPNYYDLKVMQDVRLTWSGTFVHAAPWSVAHQGVSNVSHGCINLSTARATAYYNLVRYGDLVTVDHTLRGPADLLAAQDPGMADWNTTWSSWVAGSALRVAVTTGHLV